MAEAARRQRVLVLGSIAPAGLALLPAERYELGADMDQPDAIVLRSTDLHARPLPASLLAVARAGAGTDNVPVQQLSARGVPVFNAPGGNANAVKELVLAALLMSLRRLPAALQFVQTLDPAADDFEARMEAGKKAFAGQELAGRTLGVIGLGRIGCLVADAAIHLGMEVLGFDPDITVDAAWSLPSQVKRAGSVAEVLKGSHAVTLHVPLLPATRGIVGLANLGLMRPGALLLNFSRQGVVDDSAVLQALQDGRLGGYACDFPTPALQGQPQVLALPHLGASTAEAEEQCALMVLRQLRAYLEDGEIVNAVNFPAVQMARESAWRVGIANANVPNMLGQISTTMAQAGLNIHNMVNKSRGEMAYTLVDVDSPVSPGVLSALRGIAGVLAVRELPQR